jgi:hypothetical protein
MNMIVCMYCWQHSPPPRSGGDGKAASGAGAGGSGADEAGNNRCEALAKAALFSLDFVCCSASLLDDCSMWHQPGRRHRVYTHVCCGRSAACLICMACIRAPCYHHVLPPLYAVARAAPCALASNSHNRGLYNKFVCAWTGNRSGDMRCAHNSLQVIILLLLLMPAGLPTPRTPTSARPPRATSQPARSCRPSGRRCWRA